MNLRHLGLAAFASLALLIMAWPAAAATPRAAVTPPPEGAATWTALPLGLQLVPKATAYVGTSRGPSGSVWVVGSVPGTAPAVAARVARVRLSDGAVLKSWSYPRSGASFRPRAIASDRARNLYVTGNRGGDWLTVKFRPTGGVAWTRTYDSGGGDTPYALASDDAGNVLVAGMRGGPGGGDALVIAYSGAGVMRWQGRLRTNSKDVFRAVAVDGSRNVYVAGLKSGIGWGVVRSYAPDGRFRWEHSSLVDGSRTVFDQLVVKGTRVTVAGTGGSGADARMVAGRYSTNAKGTSVWDALKVNRTYLDGSLVGGLAVDSSGDVVIAGVAYGYGIPAVDTPIVWKLRGTNGTTLWRREFVNPAWPHDGEFDAVGVDSAGRIYAGGGISGTAGDALMVRYAADGTAQAMWLTSGAGSGACTFDQVLVLSDTQVLGGALVTGVSGRQAGVYRADTVLP